MKREFACAALLLSAASLFGEETAIDLETIVVTEPVEVAEFNHRCEPIGELQFDSKELTKLPSVGEADMSRALKYLPGVSSANENSSELIVHGGAPEQNLTILDDIPLYSIDHFFGFFSPFNSDAVSSVKLYRSFYPAWFDDRLSSVAEYQSKVIPADTLESAVNLSMLALSGTVNSPITKRISMLASARRSYSDLVKTPLYDRIFHQFSNDGEMSKDLHNFEVNRVPTFHFYDISGKISFNASEKDTISSSIYTGKDFLSTLSKAHSTHLIQLNPTPLSIVPRSVDVKLENTGFWGNLGVSGNWKHRWSASSISKLTLGRSGCSFGMTENFFTGAVIGDTVTAPFESKQTRTADNGLQDIFGTYRTTMLKSRHTIDFGLDVHRYSCSYNQHESYTQLTGGVQGEESEVYTIQDSSKVSRLYQQSYLPALWAQDQFKLSEKLTMVGAVRGAYYSGTKKMYASPRLSAVYNPFRLLTLKGSGAVIHQYLHRSPMYDLYLEGDRYYWMQARENGAPVSRAEKGTAGFTFKPAGIMIDAEAYWNRQHGLSVFKKTFSPSTSDFAVGEGWTRGVDLQIQKSFGMYTGWVSGSLSRSIQQFGSEINHGKPFISPYDHPVECKIVNMLDIKKFNLTAAWSFASGGSYEIPVGTYRPDYYAWTTTTFGLGGWKNSSRYPNYQRLDVSASYKFTPGKRMAYGINASVFNCFNRKNIRNYDYLHVLGLDGVSVFDDQIYRTESYYLGIVPSLTITAELKQPLGESR